MRLPRFNEKSYAHFVTTKAYANQQIFKSKECCDILLKNIEYYEKRLGFVLVGYCIMPDPARYA